MSPALEPFPAYRTAQSSPFIHDLCHAVRTGDLRLVVCTLPRHARVRDSGATKRHSTAMPPASSDGEEGVARVRYQHLVVRPFRPGDAAGVIALVSAVLVEYGFTPSLACSEADIVHVAAQYASGEFWVAVTSAATVVATCAFRPVRPPSASTSAGAVAELRRLYVRRDLRRRGIGGMLLRASERRAFRAGFSTMLLESDTALREATQLYAAQGYSRSKLPDSVDGTCRCNIVMAKDLSAPSPQRDGEAVVVVDESGNRFAELPVAYVRRGRMRVLAAAVLRVRGHRVAVLRGSAHAGEIAVVPAGENVDIVANRLTGGAAERTGEAGAIDRETKHGTERLFAHVFVVRCSEEEETFQWADASDALTPFQRGSLRNALSRLL